MLIAGLVGLVLIYNRIPTLFSLRPQGEIKGIYASPPRIPESPFERRGSVTISGKVGTGGGIKTGTGAATPAKTPKPVTIISKTVTPPSLYRSVKIGSVSVGTYYSPQYATVVLYGDSAMSIDITGWKIISREDSIVIPQAYKIYGGSAADGLTDISIGRGGKVTLYTHTGAIIPGFEINKCMGYLTRTVNFNPYFYASCPSLDLKSVSDFSSQCQDYVRRLSACELPSSNPPIRYDDAQCFDYLKKINYSTCVDSHRFDADFIGGEWLVWLGDSFGRAKNIFDSLHDKVRLISKDGVLIDEYVY